MAKQGRETGSAALVVSHPPHMLLVLEWIARARPWCYVLTDGSGTGGEPTAAAMREIVADLGARMGFLSGAVPDRELYRQLLAGEDRLIDLAERMLADWLEKGVERVAGDRFEGMNVAHDLTRILINACVERAKRRHERDIACYEFAVSELADALEPVPGALSIEVGREMVTRKRTCALRVQPDAVRWLNEHNGFDVLERLHVEVLRPSAGPRGLEWAGAERPWYERHAETLQAEGRIAVVIRYREHVQPRAEALWKWACGA